MKRHSLGRLGAGALLVLAFAGCSAGLNQTVVTCPAGRTLLDGVCVGEAIADYVACVRAQGAQLGGSKQQQISTEVGTAGLRAGGAVELRETLEKRYAASDTAMLEIIKRCNDAAGGPRGKAIAESARPPVAPAAAPALGCFVDAESRDLAGANLEDPGMSVAVCRRQCGDRGFAYAGVQYGKQCFCGDSFGKYGRVADADCNMPCAGNPGESCGGTWRNTVYRTVEPLGCFVDADDRDLGQAPFSSPQMSVDVCAKHCRSKGFTFAGVQYADQCFCGNSHGRYGRAADADCRTPCAGKPGEICGGTWRNSIYKVR